MNSGFVGIDGPWLLWHVKNRFGIKGGMALPENITAYSTAIKGIRHTYRRMARSINR